MLILKPGLSRPQQVIVRPPQHIRIVDHKACRRYGKTLEARAIIIEQAVCLGKRVLYLVPEAAQFQDMYDFFAHTPLIKCRHEEYGCKVQPTPHLTFISGGYVAFRSLESIQGARGGEFDVVIVDEQQDLKCSFEEFDQVVSPMLKNRRGRLYFFGQFRGKGWQFYKYFVPGVPPGQLYYDKALYDPTYMSVRSPWQEALFYQTDIGRIELENDRRRWMPNMFRQEYDCECLEAAEGVFHSVDRAVKEAPAAHRRPRPGEVYYIMWDAGKTANPPAVVVLAKYAGVVCIADSMDLHLDYKLQRDHIAMLARWYGPNVCIGVDITSAGTNSSSLLDFCRDTIPNLNGIYFGQTAKEDFVTLTERSMQIGSVKIPQEFTELLHQLRRYEYDRHPITQKYQYHAPKGEFDDLVAAFIGALHMRDQNWGPNPNGSSFGSTVG